MKENKRPCSGTFCQMPSSHDKEKCKFIGECSDYTPLADTGGMEAVIDMAIKQFNLDDEKDRAKLHILFDAYVSQYMAAFCHL